MKKMMIRADDLGYSEAVNYGIEKSVKCGIINNVGFMVNMDASEHGYHLIKDCDVSLGCHTNICVGKPICDPKLIPSITNGNEFKSSKEYRSSKEDFVVLEEVILEIEAQYEKFKQITGREPDYFEGHAIDSPNFIKGLEIVANRHNLLFSGISFDGTPILVNNQQVYMNMGNTSSDDYDPFKTFVDMYENAKVGFNLLIFHPGYLDHYLLNHSSLTLPRTKEVEASCSDEMKDFIKNNDIKLYTYSELSKIDK